MVVSPSTLKDGDVQQAKRVLASQGYDFELGKAIAQSPDIARAIVVEANRLLREQNVTVKVNKKALRDLVRGMYLDPYSQARDMRRLNQRFELGYSEKDFRAVLAAPKPENDTGFVTPVLVPYRASLEETLDVLWELALGRRDINAQYRSRQFMEVVANAGIAPKNGLRWEVIDLGAMLGQDIFALPTDAIRTAPHAGILAAFLLFPRWVELMSWGEVPNVWLSGCKGRNDQFIGLYADRASGKSDRCIMMTSRRDWVRAGLDITSFAIPQFVPAKRY